MADVIREKDIWVYSYRIPPEINSSIKMDVGIEDCLHIEFEYSKSKYHLKDVIVGRIYFLLVRLKIKHMELSIIRRETTGVAPNQYNESETLVRFEIMDGSPSRGETIPIRLFLGGFDLTPTFREVNKKYSVRYYLSLVLIDEGTFYPSPCLIDPFPLLLLHRRFSRCRSFLTSDCGNLPSCLIPGAAFIRFLRIFPRVPTLWRFACFKAHRSFPHRLSPSHTLHPQTGYAT